MAHVVTKQIFQRWLMRGMKASLEKKLSTLNLAERIPAVSCMKTLVPSVVERSVSQAQVVSDVYVKPANQEEVIDGSIQDEKITKDVIGKVNSQIENQSHGRLFAIVHVCGKQFRVTAEDMIIIEGYWPPELGDELKLEKVLLVGGSDFTLFGRPILSPELVTVNATVIEKTLSHIKTIFKKRPRKQYMRMNFHRSPYTMLRIKSIEIKGKVNEKKDIEGIEERLF